MRRLALLWLLMTLSLSIKAEPTLRVAVASNFSTTAAELFADFQLRHKVNIVSLIGSSGKHVAQIKHGLEVDVFLAADRERPQWLESNGHAVEGSRFTYALGQLAFFSLKQAHLNSIENNDFKFASIAIANPKLAPYGVAAIDVLKHYKVVSDVGVSTDSNLKIVRGDNVAQAFQFAVSGAADVALIAYSQTLNMQHGYAKLISDSLHASIEQQAIMIRPSVPAETLMAYLKSSPALAIIQRSGYRRP